MSWRDVDVYGSHLKIHGEVEVVRPQRLTDVVNRFGDYVELHAATVEPLLPNYPVLSRQEPIMVLAKPAIVLVCPSDPGVEGQVRSPLWRQKIRCDVAFTTETYSMVADVYLEPNRTLQDHLERYRNDFLPLTNISALWVATSAETLSVQRAFGLLNPACVLSFAVHTD